MQLQCGLCKEASCVQPRVPVSGHHHLLLTVTLRKRPSAEAFCGSKPRPRDSGPPLDPATAGGARLSRFLAARLRSEEHTSELQSLMRISYAVFCLKKKKNK